MRHATEGIKTGEKGKRKTVSGDALKIKTEKSVRCVRAVTITRVPRLTAAAAELLSGGVSGRRPCQRRRRGLVA